MSDNQIRTQYLFSDQAHRDKMIMDALVEIEALRRENEEVRFQLQQLTGGNVSRKRPKIIS